MLAKDLGFGAHVLTVVVASGVAGVLAGASRRVREETFFFSNATPRRRRDFPSRAGKSMAPDSVTTHIVIGAMAAFVALVVEALLFILRDAKT
jgi:hypothetical protein